jgi:NADH-quinone oxidoreductase subunit L
MINEAGVWAIFFLPLATFAIIGLVIRPFFNRHSITAGWLLILALAVALVLSIWTLKSVIEEGPLQFDPHTWLELGGLEINIGLMVDSLTAIMLVVVTGVSLMVQIYSQGYMKGDPGYARYYAFMALFSAAMLGLVMSSDILQLYAMWELVGLGSFLLIGFWNDRPAAAAAAKKAFLVTRIGDFGFLLAILYLFFNRDAFLAQGLNPLHIPDIHTAIPLIQEGAIAAFGGLGLTWLGVGIFAGAAGKSAQFPFHVWLPDAMEGPTPVSALIHAATMVAAGVFLVARFFPVFDASHEAMSAVAIIGAFTALFAATMGLVNNDIKRVLAFSTISQLGYMMAALGIGAYSVAIFHLFTHAFFKALLFLGAGSVNHAAGTFDMRYMGGLRKVMPWTYAFMLIGGLALVGIFPLAGFWSKDEILGYAWHFYGDEMRTPWVFWMLVIGVALTAFYTFRMLYMTFHGEFRGGAEAEQRAHASPAHDQGEYHVHLAESPLVMLLPMGILAIAAVVAGYVANPQQEFLGVPAHWFSEFVVPPGGLAEVLDINIGLALVITLLSLAAIGLSTAMYLKGVNGPVWVEKVMAPAHKVLSNRYYMDHLYERVIVSRFFYRRTAAFLEWFDQQIIDNVVDAAGWASRSVGWGIGKVQNGQVQAYAFGISLGVLVILMSYLIWG